jgi:ABC-type glycerol-3-phosphate transport system substrate-binding protein
MSRLGLLVLAVSAALSACAPAADNGEENTQAEAQMAATDPVAQVAALEQQSGENTVRVMITVSGEGAERDAAVAEVAAAMNQSGAVLVEVLEGQPIVVVEAQPAQLRAALDTGRVQSVTPDTPAPTN